MTQLEENKEAQNLLEKGIALHKSEDFEGAVDAFTKAVELDPGMAIAYYNRGMSYYSLQQWNPGMEDISHALNLDMMVAADPGACSMKAQTPSYTPVTIPGTTTPVIKPQADMNADTVRKNYFKPNEPEIQKVIKIIPDKEPPPPPPKIKEVEVVEETVEVQVFKVFCPGCGAPLKLKGSQAIITCRYCGLESKVEMKLRKIEPDIPRVPPPKTAGNSENPYTKWSTSQLVYGILTSEDTKEKVKMADALDEWFHVNEKMAGWVPDIVEVMLKSEPELDKELAGILGKLICSDNPKFKQRVINAGEKYGFRDNGSHGLLFALSLGNAGTVKLLLDIAEWASQRDLKEYANKALIGVQTAIGRETSDGYLHVCVEVLTYRLPYLSGMVQDWILRFLRNHFDVGYTFLYPRFIELYDDCAFEFPHLLPGLSEALKRCRGAKDREDLYKRLSVYSFIKSKEAKKAALKSLGYPPNDIEFKDIEYLEEVLMPLTEDEELEKLAREAMGKFEY